MSLGHDSSLSQFMKDRAWLTWEWCAQQQKSGAFASPATRSYPKRWKVDIRPLQWTKSKTPRHEGCSSRALRLDSGQSPADQLCDLSFSQPDRHSAKQSSSHSNSQPFSQSFNQSAVQPVSQSVNQSVSQSISQPLSQSVNQSTNQVNQSASQPVIQSVSRSASRSISQPVSQSASQSASQPITCYIAAGYVITTAAVIKIQPEAAMHGTIMWSDKRYRRRWARWIYQRTTNRTAWLVCPYD